MLKLLLTLMATASLLLLGCGATAPLSSPWQSRISAHASEPLDPRFFARPEVQAKAPGAFSLQAESVPVLKSLQQESMPLRDALVSAIRADHNLLKNVRNFDRLSMEHQLGTLRRVFDLECLVLGIAPPQLVIDSQAIQGPAYFDFDPERPGAGRVILNSEALAKEPNKFMGLLLLIHETRHSAQFQHAFSRDRSVASKPYAQGYRAAFRAQKQLAKELNFCDFCSLLNEYEAFQFGNYVVGALTDWKVDTVDLGCFSSQYDAHGRLKIDLVHLAEKAGPSSLLFAFNELEREQYRQIVSPRE